MNVTLRQARLADRRRIYGWLAASDATPEMMGPPVFPDSPVPTYEEFCADYDESAYSELGDLQLFVICICGREIGAISYFIYEKIAEIDIWIGDRSDWGQGFGRRSIETIAEKLERRGSAKAMIIRPSARNRRAVAAYCKSGFELHDPQKHELPDWCLEKWLDYADSVVLVREIRQR